jgi:hypothetical protein
VNAEEFESAYAERANTTVDRLHRLGRFAQPCLCDYPACPGWSMGHQWEEAIHLDYHRTRILKETGSMNV